MSITDNKITRWNNPIVNEADRPQRSASNMKEIFDSNSNQLRDALNNLIDALASGGAEDIGAAVEGMEGQNVETILAELKGFYDALKESHDTLGENYQEFTENLSGTDGAGMVGASIEGIEGDSVASVLAALKVLCDRIITNSDGKLFLANDGTYRLPSVGASANGLPVGGDEGAILVKKSSDAYDGEWKLPGELDLMTLQDYDPNGTGTVLSAETAENANKLDGKEASEFQPAGDYAVVAAAATVLPESGTALTANTIYRVADAVGTYAFTAPVSGWAHGTFTTAATTSVSFAGTFLNEKPTIAQSKTYEFDVVDGVWAVAEVVSA